MQVIRDASTKSAKRTLEPTGHHPQWGDPTQATQETQGENTPSHMPDTELIALRLAPLSGVNPPLLFLVWAHLRHDILHHHARKLTMHATQLAGTVEGL